MTWCCGGTGLALLTDYTNNEAYQELLRFEKYFTESDNKVFGDLRRDKGYTNEIEKLTKDDSDLTVMLLQDQKWD